jgi:hypothetical protein
VSRTRTLRILAAAALALLACAAVYAQNDLATIRGVVTDQSGAVIQKAHVTLLNISTNATREADGNEAGEFEFPFVVQGNYRLTVTAGGFKSFIADHIEIRARELRRVDAKLEVGAVGSEVTVSAGAAVIATESSQISDGFTGRQFVNSPLSVQTFFPQGFMSTLPGIQTQNGNVALHFAGQTAAQVAENMDGMTNDTANNLTQNMNDFQDLQVIPVNNSAEYSRVGQFTMVSKSGTNEFHGRAYYDLSNSYLNARSFFAPVKVPWKEHRAGANFNGPIIKNKLFFYFGYTMDRIPASTYYARNIPTLKMRNGDFSDFLNQASPAVIKDPLTGQPFPGNVIPASRLNSVSQALQTNYIPNPNRGAAASTFQNYGFTWPHPTDLFKWDGVTPRVDYVISSKDQLFGRFINRLTPYILAGEFPNLGSWTSMRNSSQTVVNETHIFSPAIVNSFQWGWSRDYQFSGGTINGFTPTKANTAISTLGLQGVNPQNFSVMGFPTVAITGIDTLSQPAGGVAGDRNDQQFSNETTWSFSRHVIKFGGALRHFKNYADNISADTFGNFTFNGSLTGIGYADFLLGLPYSSVRANPIVDRTLTAYELGLFIQDTFKVNTRLTLDLGLRWEYFSPARYQDGLQYNWDPSTGDVVVPQSSLGKVSALYPKTITVVAGNPYPDPTRGNLRPRLGAAYRISDRFVIRGGYGIYSEAPGNLYAVPTGGPFGISETYFNTITNGQPLLSFPNPFPSSLGLSSIPSQSVTGYPKSYTNGMIQQFNVSLEREFKGGFGGRLSYVGSRSSGLNYLLPINKPQPSLTPFTAGRRPYSQFVGVSLDQNDGKAKYDSMQVAVQKRSGGLILDAHYTFSNNMLNYLDLENPYNHLLWNRDQYNARHSFVGTASYELPFGKDRTYMRNASKLMDAALGEWQISWITYLQSGQYFTPSFSGSDPSNTNTSGGIPNCIADGNLPNGQRSPNRWFNPAAFAMPYPGTFGNCGVDILEGPGLKLQHFSAAKQFPITERVHFILQTNITNLFNTPHFDFPFANISVPAQVARVYQLRDSGGTPGGREMSGPRQLEFRFRIEF